MSASPTARCWLASPLRITSTGRMGKPEAKTRVAVTSHAGNGPVAHGRAEKPQGEPAQLGLDGNLLRRAPGNMVNEEIDRGRWWHDSSGPQFCHKQRLRLVFGLSPQRPVAVSFFPVVVGGPPRSSRRPAGRSCCHRASWTRNRTRRHLRRVPVQATVADVPQELEMVSVTVNSRARLSELNRRSVSIITAPRPWPPRLSLVVAFGCSPLASPGSSRGNCQPSSPITVRTVSSWPRSDRRTVFLSAALRSVHCCRRRQLRRSRCRSMGSTRFDTTRCFRRPP